MTIVNAEQIDRLKSDLIGLSIDQLIWVSGYISGLIDSKKPIIADSCISKKVPLLNTQYADKITLISASQTGNAYKVAKKLYDNCIKIGLNIVLFHAKDYKFKKIHETNILILITSTHGEGEPPEEAIALYKYLFSKRACKMKNTYFSVFSLGDQSYENFAKAGRDFDEQFEKLGAHRLCNRIDVGVDFEKEANMWIDQIVVLLKSRRTTYSYGDVYHNNQFKSNVASKNTFYCKESPLYARLLNSQRITSRNSEKDIHHLEIDISGSNLSYQPGDALGIWYENDPKLINELLKLLNLSGNELVDIKGQSICLHEALQKHYELMQNTSVFIKNVAYVSQNKELLNLYNNKEQLRSFVLNTPIIDMLYQIPVKLTSQDILNIFHPITPRFYSISSAQSEVGEEVHITVSVVRYQIHGRFRSGGASSYLVDRLKENDKVRIFVESNNNFRLPVDSNISIIMIGSGTGIAPFRSFMQQRYVNKAAGKNWLFFGNPRFVDDFLYQTEWQYYKKEGLMTKINTAWSRDQEHKVYVQDRLLENGAEVWSWIVEGAHIYVCGNAKYMARAVEQALVTLVSKYGSMNIEQSNDFWDEMRIQHRYQRDVY